MPRRNQERVWLSERFDQALQYASVIHAGQFRKSTGIPYISHLLGVASIALEYGANEDEAIAALLHDAGEDAGGEGRVADIRVRFGDKVAKIVEGCSDTVITPKPPWRERKETYIAHLESADASTILVSASDKLYNARAILRDVRRDGDAAFDRFNGKKDGTLWYYRALVIAFRKHGESELLHELDRVVSEIQMSSLTIHWQSARLTEDRRARGHGFGVYAGSTSDRLGPLVAFVEGFKWHHGGNKALVLFDPQLVPANELEFAALKAAIEARIRAGDISGSEVMPGYQGLANA